MKLVVEPLAEVDLDRAGQWYEERQPGLRLRFLHEIDRVLTQLRHNPELYQVVHLHIRRAPTRRFPYGVYYVVGDDLIRILGVIHDARHASVWRSRAPR
jgi:toxin ParE1/3/4